ncbi:MAG: inorganic phosphate transporter [Ignavibacteria bacterium]|nr:inorganic phosphate transporter [Ignavibacteria bacterium]
MEFYLFVLIVLFCTAIADLYAGVANDAVNFLNSAVGSRAASRVTIMIVASLGVLAGTMFSSGMMEVARRGIFNPEMFTFHEVMVIFLAVMLTDIILLDLYNTFGLPTSTTVSIVFELLGGAVAVSVIKVTQMGGVFGDVLQFLNTERVLTIISSIGLSIVIAFVFGVTIQFITRIIFTFDYEKTFRRYGALYCGTALTAITYFILVKGASGSAVLTSEHVSWIRSNIVEILVYSFVIWVIVWQLVISLTKIPVLKIIVLIGTFALALSFAANDLVNFIGAPMGALGAYELASGSGGDVANLMMGGLAAPVRANTLILLVAGAIMVMTLWFSRKARSVTETEVTLGRQEEGVERFESSLLSRTIVRMALGLFSVVQRAVPLTLQRAIAGRLDLSKAKLVAADDGPPPAFDLLRAAVNLMVASALISLGTSLKLPLSTTFVTFMVAMSTSFADRAWGRESAVYRVNGVITVIGGWFFTALLAFTATFAFAYAIYYGKLPAILGLVAFGFFFYFRSNRLHSTREAEFARRESEVGTLAAPLGRFEGNMKTVARYMRDVSETIRECYEGLMKEGRRELKNSLYRAGTLSKDGDRIVTDILEVMKSTAEGEHAASPRYARKIGALQIIGINLSSLTNASHTYIINNHQPLDEEQIQEMKRVREEALGVIASCITMLETKDFSELPTQRDRLAQLKETIREFDRHQMKRVKAGKSKTRQSLIFIGTLNKAERIADQAIVLADLYDESHTELSA